METRNSYDNAKMAAAYARLEFPGTYYLAYRDLPDIIAEHVRGSRALDFGCGTGRSTRFLRKLYEAAGLELIETRKPLGKPSEPQAWVNETRIAPWVIYVVQKARTSGEAVR